ncbi:MAG: hypothetical protein ACJ72B_01645 [Ornithinibacter sp.]
MVRPHVEVLVTPGRSAVVHDRLVAGARGAARGQLPEATDLYLRFALGPVVRLLRIRHCPWRHDYGLRYLHADLPTDVAARVDALLPGGAPLPALSAAAFAWMDELLGSAGP